MVDMYGKIIESELLGETKKEMAYFDELHEMPTYLKYRSSVEFVKTHQRADPFNPKRFFPKSLRDGLKEDTSLGITSEEQLGFYTALNSAMDQYHGVDAFFEYKRENKTILVTIDVTTNPSKDRHKADVILAIPSEGLDPSDSDYNEIVSGYIEQIKEELLTKLNY